MIILYHRVRLRSSQIKLGTVSPFLVSPLIFLIAPKDGVGDDLLDFGKEWLDFGAGESVALFERFVKAGNATELLNDECSGALYLVGNLNDVFDGVYPRMKRGAEFVSDGRGIDDEIGCLLYCVYVPLDPDCAVVFCERGFVIHCDEIYQLLIDDLPNYLGECTVCVEFYLDFELSEAMQEVGKVFVNRWFTTSDDYAIDQFPAFGEFSDNVFRREKGNLRESHNQAGILAIWASEITPAGKDDRSDRTGIVN